jgi:hypothetical protein
MDAEHVPMSIRIVAANAVLPDQRAKVTDPPLPEPVPLIECKCAADAEHNIGTINYFESQGRIGSGQAASLRAGQKDWIEAHIVSSIQIDARAAF